MKKQSFFENAAGLIRSPRLPIFMIVFVDVLELGITLPALIGVNIFRFPIHRPVAEPVPATE